MNSEIQFRHQLVRYSRRLDYFLKTMGISSPEDREDMVQDVLVKASGAETSYDGRYAFSTWLYTIARRTAVDYLRKRNFVQEPFEDIYPSSFPKPEDALLRQEERAFVHRFISGLDPADRQITYLRYFEDLPIKKIASALGISSGTVKFRLHEIRRRLKEARRFHESKS